MSDNDTLKFDPSLGPGEITINQSGRVLVTIKADGSMVFGDHYTPDAAAMAFWDAVSRHHPLRAPAEPQ